MTSFMSDAKLTDTDVRIVVTGEGDEDGPPVSLSC